MSRLVQKVTLVVLFVILGTLLHEGFQEAWLCGGCAPHFAYAQELAGTSKDTSTLCTELDDNGWVDQDFLVYARLAEKHNAANVATEDCSTHEARETIRLLFSQAAVLFEELLDEVEAFADRYSAIPGFTDAIADAVQQTAVMCADYQIGVQYMIDMTYAYAEENMSEGLALGEAGADYCNQAMTVDDVLLAIYDTISTAFCQEPAIELLSPAMGAIINGSLVLFEWSPVDTTSSYTLVIRQLPDPDYWSEVVEVRSLYEIPETFFDVVYEITIPGMAEVSPPVTEYEFELQPGATYAWQVFSFLDGELIGQSDCGWCSCATEPSDIELGAIYDDCYEDCGWCTCAISIAEDISLHFSGHLAAGEGMCRQITDTKISCQVSPGSPVILELEAMVRNPLSAEPFSFGVSISAWELPPWVSFEPASGVGSVSTQAIINGPGVVSGFHNPTVAIINAPDVATGFHDPTVTLVFTATTAYELQAQLEVELVLNQPVPSGYGELDLLSYDGPASQPIAFGEETDQGIDSSMVDTSLQTNQPIFSWIVDVELLEEYADFTYEWVLVERFPGQTEEEALAVNPVLYELKNGLTTNGFRYPVGAPEFEPDKEYCWLVKAIAGTQVVASSNPHGFRLVEGFPDPHAPVQLLAPGNGTSIASTGSVFEWELTAPSATPPTESYRVLVWELPELMPGFEPCLPIGFEFSTCELGSPTATEDLKEGYVDRAIELERQYIDKYNKLKSDYEDDLRKLEEQWKKDTEEWGEEDAWIMFLENVADLNRRYNGYLRALAESFFNDFCRLEDDYSPEYKEYFTRRFFGYPDDLLYVPPPPGYENLDEEEIPYLAPGIPPPVILPLVNQLSDLLNDVWVPFYESLWNQRYEEHPITEADIVEQAPIAIIEVPSGGSVPIPFLCANTSYAWQVHALRQTRLGTIEVIGVSDMQSFTVSEPSDDEDEDCEVRYVQVRRVNVMSEPDELTGDVLESVIYNQKVEVLECDEDETWWKVRTANGTVGWVPQSVLIEDKRPIVQGKVQEGKAAADGEVGTGVKG